MLPPSGLSPLSSGSAHLPGVAAVGVSSASGKIPRAKPIMPKQAVFRHGSIAAAQQNYLVCISKLSLALGPVAGKGL